MDSPKRQCWESAFVNNGLINVYFLPAGYNVPTANYPNAMLKVLGLVNKNIKAVIPQCGKVTKFDNTKVCSVINLKFVPYRPYYIHVLFSLKCILGVLIILFFKAFATSDRF